MTKAIWKRPCINLFITYFASADNMLLPFTRGQITCYCPRKMLLARRKITCRKLCFYYTCKFSVISIKYVIIDFNVRKGQMENVQIINKAWCWTWHTLHIKNIPRCVHYIWPQKMSVRFPKTLINHSFSIQIFNLVETINFLFGRCV